MKSARDRGNQHRRNSLLFLLAALALVAVVPGCLYSAMGAEHNIPAAERLKPGMTLEACIAELAAGATVELEWTRPLDTELERKTALESDELRASLTHAEEQTGKHATEGVLLNRQWGFMGFGEFHLFLDESEELVGYHLLHIN